MPRRHLRVLILALIVSLACYVQASRATRYRYARIVHQALAQIEANYLEKTDPQKLFDAAMTGMTSRLDDYSAYIDSREYDQLNDELEQHFGGVGIQVGLDPETKQLTVITPLPGTPAFEAGVRPGDRIVAIEGESTENFKLEDATSRLRGEAGTDVSLTVARGEQRIDFTLSRALIETQTIEGDMRNSDMSWNFFLPGDERWAYIRVSPMFSERTVEELTAALAKVRAGGARGLVLDLRNNPGGLLESAVKTCNLFIAEGAIVSTRGRDGVPMREFQADGSAICTDLPMAVLVNHASASASEIVAACLQDDARAVVVGERSFGKGSVQDLITLEGRHSALKLTVASYWRPSGRNIHRTSTATESDDWGVMPDKGYELKLDTEQLEALMLWRRDRDVVEPSAQAASQEGSAVAAAKNSNPLERDLQLAKAVEYLRMKQPSAGK